MTDKQIIDNLGSEKCVHRAHLGYKDAPYFKKCYSCRLQNHQLEAVQANNTTEYWYKCNTENCLFKKLEAKEQECEELKELYNYYAFDRRKPENITELKICINSVNEELIRLQQENEELKKELKNTKGLAMLRYQCLEAIKELANNANLPNVGLYIDSFLNEISNKDENCHFDKIKELTKEL